MSQRAEAVRDLGHSANVGIHNLVNPITDWLNSYGLYAGSFILEFQADMLGSAIETTAGVYAMGQDPLSTLEGIGCLASDYYGRGDGGFCGVAAVIGSFNGLLGAYESYQGVDLLQTRKRRIR